jgi:hypothetical protein
MKRKLMPPTVAKSEGIQTPTVAKETPIFNASFRITSHHHSNVIHPLSKTNVQIRIFPTHFTDVIINKMEHPICKIPDQKLGTNRQHPSVK